jgi:hypothetical protein
MKPKTKKIIFKIFAAFVALATIFFMVAPFAGF